MSEFAGSLNQRVEFWQRSAERLATGASVEEQSFVRSCLASVVADGAGPADEAMSVSAMARFRFTVRRHDEIAIDHHVRWRGRHFVILQIGEDPRTPDRVMLRCEEQRR